MFYNQKPQTRPEVFSRFPKYNMVLNVGIFGAKSSIFMLKIWKHISFFIYQYTDCDTFFDQDLSDIIENLSSLALKDCGSSNTNGPQVLINTERHKPTAQSSCDDSEIQSRKPSNVSIHRKQSVDKVIRSTCISGQMSSLMNLFHFRDGKAVYLHILILALVSLPTIRRATPSTRCPTLIKQ